MSYKGYRKLNKHKTFASRTQVYLKDGRFFIVDPSDYEKISHMTWGVTTGRGRRNNQYICSHTWGQKRVLLHRLLMNTPEGLFVDHINGDEFNNRRTNLRVVTRGENVKNQTKKNGKASIPCVTYCKTRKRFRVRLRIDGKNKHMGYRNSQAEAEALAIELKNKYYGEYSPHHRR